MAVNIEAAVFDVDGTLLDTRQFIYQAFEASLREHGHPVPTRPAIAAQIGRSLAACYKVLAPGDDNNQLCQTHQAFQAANLDLVQPFENASEMLETLQYAGIKLGIFSSRHTNLLPTLANAGILQFFGAIIEGDQVAHPKPHPEGFIKALDKLGSQACRAAMVGDAAVDVEAGKAGHAALTIAVSHGFGTFSSLQSARPGYIVSSLRLIPGALLPAPGPIMSY